MTVGSFMAFLFQAHLLHHALHGAGELHAASLRLTAQPGGDVGPTEALAAQVGQLSFLRAQAFPETAEQVLSAC